MASSKEYLEFVLEQLAELDEITYRAMMGEYIIYYRGKIVGGIYDDRLLVKKTSTALELMPEAICDIPYEGAKEMRVETERLILRSFEEKDADGVLRLWANPRANCYVRDRISTREEALQRIRRSKPEYDLAVCRKEDDAFMGTVFGLREEPDSA